MTHKAFWDDPYLSELATRIATVDGERVTLQATIFYAESGGQESDTGSIAGQPVLLAEKLGRDIVYTLAAGHGLQPGDAVTVRIDWPRRYRLMRLHFAAELTLETICRDLDGVQKIGAHIGEHKARIDFALPQPITPQLATITARVQALIDADAAIVSAFTDVAAEHRYWEVPGYCRVPCGGTHLRHKAHRRGWSHRAEAQERRPRQGAGGDHAAGRLVAASVSPNRRLQQRAESYTSSHYLTLRRGKHEA